MLVPIIVSIGWVGRAGTPDLILAEADLAWLSSVGCHDCFQCDYGHEFDSNPLPLAGREGTHECEPGSCGVHGMCDPDMASALMGPDVKATLKAIRGATPEELLALVAKYPHRLRVNQSRRALQLAGCGDSVVASYGTMSVPSLAVLLD